MAATTYTLKHAIELKSKEGAAVETITSVTIQRPKGKHFRAMKSESKVAMSLELLGACAGLPPSTVDLIDGDDLVPLMEIVGDFFGFSPPTGGTS